MPLTLCWRLKNLRQSLTVLTVDHTLLSGIQRRLLQSIHVTGDCGFVASNTISRFCLQNICLLPCEYCFRLLYTFRYNRLQSFTSTFSLLSFVFSIPYTYTNTNNHNYFIATLRLHFLAY